MAPSNGITLSASQKSQLSAIQSTARLIDNVQLRLASGLSVNSAIDDPQNFFSSQALRFRSSDLSRRLDGIGTSIKTIQEAEIGSNAILNLLDLAQSQIEQALIEIYSDSEINSLKTQLSDDDITRILAENPTVVYNTQTESFYESINTATTVINAINDANSSQIDGVSGHLVNITSAQENTYIRSIMGGESWIGASDADSEGRWVWIGGPEADLNFFNGAVGGTTVPGQYENWRNNEPNDAGSGEDYAVMRTDGFWNDLRGINSRRYVIEWDKSSFITDVDEKLTQRAKEYSTQYLETLSQIDTIVNDANYRGINLLGDEDLETLFNETGSSRLKTKGVDFTRLGLGLNDLDFLTRDGLNQAIKEIGQARQNVREYLSTLSNDLNIIRTRQTFTRETIQALLSGSDDLSLIDQNEVGAELLALQVRQNIQVNTLAIGAQGEALITNFI